MYNYADDNSVSVNHNELNVLSRQLQAEAEVTVQLWFSDNAMKANPAKFQGSLLKGNKEAGDFRVMIQGQEIEFSKSITALGICIDENLTFDEHVNNDDICLKASRQICALQRLTGLLDMPSRKVIYNSFIVSNFNNFLIIVHLFGILPAGKVKIKCKRSRDGHYVLCLKIVHLIMTLIDQMWLGFISNIITKSNGRWNL